MKTLQGQFLIAAPELEDPNFAKSVVLLVQHNEEGAMGLVINQPMELSIAQAWDQADHPPQDVCKLDGLIHRGGPCDGPLAAISTSSMASEIHVGPGIHFCVEYDKIKWLMTQGDVPVKMCLGYAGWSPGQLEEELETDSWLTLPALPADIFHEPEHDLWPNLYHRAKVVRELPRINPRTIPTDPSLN